MKYDLSKIVGLFVLVMVLTIFWRPIVWIALIGMVALIIFGLKVLITSSKVKDEINQDPNAYFEQFEKSKKSQDVFDADVIDVEYTEKEVGPNE